LEQFGAPRQAEPDQHVAAVLKIDPVTGTGRVRDQHLDLSRIPGIDQFGLQFAGEWKAFADSFDLVPEAAEHQRRAIVSFMQLGQFVEPAIVQPDPFSIFTVHRAAYDLRQFADHRDVR
jgi:hypothetical protein